MREWMSDVRIFCKVHGIRKHHFTWVLSKWDDCCIVVHAKRTFSWFTGCWFHWWQKRVSCTGEGKKNTQKYVNIWSWHFYRTTRAQIWASTSPCVWVYGMQCMRLMSEILYSKFCREKISGSTGEKGKNKKSHTHALVCATSFIFTWNEMKRKSNNLWRIATMSWNRSKYTL